MAGINTNKADISTNKDDIISNKDAIAAHHTVCLKSDDWREFENRCYRLFNSTKDWSSARAHCQSLHAELASIHSSTEQDFVYNMIKDLGRSYIWIGGNDHLVEGQYKWSDGTTWDYNGWYSGQPNSASDRVVGMSPTRNGEWFDRPETGVYGFVCKI